MLRGFACFLIGALVLGCKGDPGPATEEPPVPDEATLDAHDDEVSRLIKVGKDDVRACGLAENTGADALVGKLQVSFEIKEDGSIGTINVDENGTGDPGVATCVSGVIAGWQFPAHPAGEAVQFTYPFEVGPKP